MLEKPNLADETVVAALREGYGLDVAELEFLPIGYDATAWVYRVHTTAGETYFLKVKKGPVYEPGVTVPRYLSDHGIEQVVAPLPTRKQTLGPERISFI